ncbi:MAG: hypothetical protein QXP04_04700, partial [Candidatus Nanoarchaeia archaeon]|nr:hypothetical protein [Candidatus Jingweiarchaeum tengchongense]
MRKYKGIFIFIFVFSNLVFSQNILWNISIDSGYNDYGYDAIQTSDGGYAVVGICESNKACIYKLDEYGNIQWNRSFDFSNEGRDNAFYSLLQTSDNGYVITGDTVSPISRDFDAILVRLNSNGDLIWNTSFDGGYDETGSSVIETDDGYVITGWSSSTTNSDLLVVKFDFSGNIIWNRTLGGSGYEEGRAIKNIFNYSYTIIGSTTSKGNGGSDIWLVNVNKNGELNWDFTFGGSNDDYGYSIDIDKYGNYIICGQTYSFGAGNSDFWLILADSAGGERFNKTIGGSSSEACHSVAAIDGGGYIATGESWSFGNSGQVYTVKLSENLNDVIWNFTFGGTRYDTAESIKRANEGFISSGISSLGTSPSNILVIKYGSDITPPIPPSITLFTPTNGIIISENYVDFVFVCEDDRDTNIFCELYINNSVVNSSFVSNGSSSSLRASNLVSGNYNGYIRCNDSENNQNTSEPRSFNVEVSYCGNSICESGENYLNCPSDCQPYCGDLICSYPENCSNCQTDCGICNYTGCPPENPIRCGTQCCPLETTSCNGDSCCVARVDGLCCGNTQYPCYVNGSPWCCNCPPNHLNCFGTCVNILTSNSNCGTCRRVCSSGTTCINGNCVSQIFCGNGICESGESCSSCPQDCGSCPSSE